MQAGIHTDEGQLVTALMTAFAERMNGAGDEPEAREAYREGFTRLRSHLDMYPVSGRRASVTFESAARTVRGVAAGCLPLGIAVAMHLYPLCVLQCMPLPLLSLARFQRAMLLRAIRNRSLILANAGGERTRGGQHPVVARQDADGIRIDGTFEYVSLATVADVVLFKARLAGGNGTVLCAADLRSDSVRTGGWRFSGSMRLSDTSPVTFARHRVPHGRYVLVADDEAVRCASDYQRCWFHLFVAEMYLARLERLHRVWRLPRSAEQIMSLNELAQLREYALRLLDDFASGSDIQALKKTTSAMKLRVSVMAGATMASLRDREDSTPADAGQLRADGSELRYIKSQPTADETILRSIGALPLSGASIRSPARQRRSRRRLVYAGRERQFSSIRTTVALQGQKRPPPKPTPSRSTSEGRPSHSSIVNSANSTSSRCQLHPVLTCVPDTMRPFGMRAGPPAWAARAAATCCGLVSETRKVSPNTSNVATAPADGPFGVSSPHAGANNRKKATQAMDPCLVRISPLPPSIP